MFRILLGLITLPLLAWIFSPFVVYILEMRGTFAVLLAQTTIVNWLGITAMFSTIALSLVIYIYSFFH